MSGTTSNWAMKLTTDSETYPITIDNGYDSYSVVPTTYTKVASRTSDTDVGDNATGTTLTTTYAAFISSSQDAGTYTGKVKYTIVHPISEIPAQPQITQPGRICYYANTTTALGTMGCQTVSTTATSATLLASNFSREGYGFAGWSDVFDYDTNPNAHFYGPQEDITFEAGQYTGSNSGLSLYAVWVKSVGSLQDSTKVAELCGTGTGSLTTAPYDGTANLSSVSALTDQRDNQTYAIAKLADGNCWMIENLRLDNTAAHNTDGSLSQGYNTSTFVGLANPESANFSTSTVANSLYTKESDVQDKFTISGSNQAYRFPRYNNWNHQSSSANRPSNPTSNTATNSATNAGMYSYGNYYTWSAAIADTTNYTTDGDHDTTSICPIGWKLPIGNQSIANDSFGALSVALGGPEGGATANSSSTPTGAVMSTRFRSYPNNFLYAGAFTNSTTYLRGGYGYYWSSTSNNYERSAYLYLTGSMIYPGTGSYVKVHGYTVRCMVANT